MLKFNSILADQHEARFSGFIAAFIHVNLTCSIHGSRIYEDVFFRFKKVVLKKSLLSSPLQKIKP
jgi:hypothetical protein